MFWFNNQFSNLTRSILFPGGGAPSSDNYSSFNPRATPDYHSRLPDSPYSGGPAARGPRTPGDHGFDEPSRSRDRGGDDAARRNWERDRYLRGYEEDSSRFANPAAPQNSPRPNRPAEAPRPNLPPLISGPMRLPPVFRPSEPPRLPGAPTLPSLPRLPSLPPLLRPPGGSSTP